MDVNIRCGCMLLLCYVIKKESVMDKNLKVSHVMTESLILLNKTDALSKASNLFQKHHIRHLPVVEDGVVIGILSRTDLDRVSFSPQFLSEIASTESTVIDLLSVEDIMKAKPTCVYEDEDLLSTALKLANEEYHAFPVIKEVNKISGILTTTDVIKELLDLLKQNQTNF